MRTLVRSLQDRIRDVTPMGVAAYFGQVSEAPGYPYVLLWTSTGQLEQETLAGPSDLSDRLGVTMVAASAHDVLTLSSYVRPALIGFTPESDTWAMEYFREPYDSRPIDYDRDVALPHAGYPAFSVDMYRLSGTLK